MSIVIEKIQDTLNFKGCTGSQFSKNALGKIGTTGYILGLIGGFHAGIFFIAWIFATTLVESDFLYALMIWSIYMSFLCTFHFLEFFITAINQPDSLSYDSYMVNQSEAYTIAAIGSWIEFWLEYYLFGGSKFWYFITFLGVLLLIGGQIVRTLAMWQCGGNFSHIIMTDKSPEHELVTTGIYSYFRHPAYFGWFYWSVGTQLVLCNPICTIAYAAASWKFFKDRIPYEESLLAQFYGEKYIHYAQSTVIGIPYIVSPIENELRA